MPKNTPLPMQWLTVDGQNIPIVLPDHWDDDKKEWKTTGTGNPLPVANYTQSASGVWLPTSESNPMPTQLTGSNVESVRNFRSRVITSGSAFLTGTTDYSKFAWLTVGINSDSDHSNSVFIETRSVDSIIFNYSEVVLEAGSRARIVSPKYVLKTPRGNVFIRNNDTVDHTYDIDIFGGVR